ncbi:acetyltransferase, partial [Actinoplanes sp. NPDC051633]
MSHLVVRPLVAGEESLFESMPDPLPQVGKVGYADGLATGGYRPDRTWVAIDRGRLVGRAAWVLPPGAVGRPWLERFDLLAEPTFGARLLDAAHEALGGPMPYYAAVPAHWRDDPATVAVMAAPLAAARLAGLVETGERLRYSWAGGELPPPAKGIRPAAGFDEVVARLAEPDVLTGRETALAVA